MREKLFILAVVLFGSLNTAFACDFTLDSVQRDRVDGDQLFGVEFYRGFSGGSIDLDRCSFSLKRGTNPIGFVAPDPDFTLEIDDLRGYRLNFRSVANCDTVVLVNGPSGQWYFDDDNGEGLGASIDVSPADDGRYDIWIGLVGDGTEVCETMLVAETFER